MTQAHYIIRDAYPKDAVEICKLRRKVWLATYVSEQHGISRDILLKIFDFESPATLRHYRQLIKGEISGFEGQEAYQNNCAMEQGDSQNGAPDNAPDNAQNGAQNGAQDNTQKVEKFWAVEIGQKSKSRLIAYASANLCNNVLTTIYVHPDYQGQGIGQALFETICAFLDKTKPIGLRVVSYNENAIHFYKKRGFRQADFTEANIEQGRLFPSMTMYRKAEIG